MTASTSCGARMRAGADPARIRIAYEGVEGLDLDAAGNLVARTTLGDLRESVPYAYQGSGEEVQCRFALSEPLSYGFECTGWDPTQPLIIDPLIYSTFVGGSLLEEGWGLGVDPEGCAYVGGPTQSVDFPTTPGAFDLDHSGRLWDAYISKLSPSGDALVYSTYLGGTSTDDCYDITVDSGGHAYMTGLTTSCDFPITEGAPDPSLGTCGNSKSDAFITKLAADGGSLLYSTFLGGRATECGWKIAVDGEGSAYVTGITDSNDFPTTPAAFSEDSSGANDAFVTKLNPEGTAFVFSTYLGGRKDEGGRGIIPTGTGEVYVTGWTDSPHFPVTDGAFDTTYNEGLEDGFVTHLSADGRQVLHSTFLGGCDDDGGSSIALSARNDAFVLGWSKSNDFPVTPGAFDDTLGGYQDAVVVKLEADLSDLVYSTFLGGERRDTALYGGIAVDEAGNAFVTGETKSRDFPTTPSAYDRERNGQEDVFVTKLNASGSGLLWSSYLGGGYFDDGHNIIFDSAGCLYVAGCTDSWDFPTTPRAFDTEFGPPRDVFVTKIILVPPCLVDADCDDGNPCTQDRCVDFQCENPLLPDGTFCEGGMKICCSGTCTRPCWTDADCNDGNICTDDFCLGEPGICTAYCEHVLDPTNDPRCTPRTPIQLFDEGRFGNRLPWNPE